MHYAAKLPINLPRLDAFTASLRDWLIALAAWLIDTSAMARCRRRGGASCARS
jgi:hypothetical protein